MNYKDIREACCEANVQLPKTGLVDLTFGNVSVFDRSKRVFAIKPSGLDYKKLTLESIVIVDLNGEVVEGRLRPSSDTPTHRYLYKEWGDKGVLSIVHTHSRKAVSFAQAGMSIPCLGTTHCDYFNGPVPITRAMSKTEVGGEYEWETGRVIVEQFDDRDPLDVPAILVRNHGPFAWGSSSDKALENALALEVVADMTLGSLTCNPSALSAPDYLLDKHFSRKHGDGAYYGQVKPGS